MRSMASGLCLIENLSGFWAQSLRADVDSQYSLQHPLICCLRERIVRRLPFCSLPSAHVLRKKNLKAYIHLLPGLENWHLWKGVSVIYKLMKSSRLKDLNFILKNTFCPALFRYKGGLFRCTTCWFWCILPTAKWWLPA